MQKYPDIFRTLWLNIRLFGLREGLKLPIYVFGKIKVYNLGRIDIKCPVRRGLWRIGVNQCNTASPYTIFDNTGVIELHGRVWTNHGCRITNRGKIVFGGNDIISHDCVMDVRECLEFGRNISVGFGSEFIDSDMHFMVDVQSREVKGNRKPIHIGNFNWFGSHTYVKKGTRTPDYLTVASPNAVLLRDYTSDVPAHSIMGGAPAKVIGGGKRRVLNMQNEKTIRSYFYGDEPHVVYKVEEEDLDSFCAIK